MKILYILKKEPDETLTEIMERHRADNEVEVFDLRGTKDYEKLVDLIVSSDKVISW